MADYNLGTARGTIEIDSSGVNRGLSDAQNQTQQFDQKMKSASGTLLQVGATAGIASAAIGGGLLIAVNSAANFEERISAIGAVSGATGKQLDQAREKALQLGADTKFSAGEAASAMEELIKAGLSVDDVLNGAADATTALAAAGEIDLPAAATIAANAMNQFGLAAADLPKVADLIAGAANASAIDVGEFGMSMQQAGATANLVGLSFDDLAVAIAAMGNAGIRGSDAGTSLKTFLSNLQPTTEKQIGLMKELGLVTEDGANQFFDASGKIKSMSDIAGILSTALAGQTEQQKALTLETLFGSDAIRAAAVIANNGKQGFDDLATSMGKVTAADVAAKRMDNLKGSIEQLKGSVETAMITFGEAFQPVLKKVADAVTKVVNAFANMPAGLQTAIALFAAVVAGLLGMVAVFGFLAGGALKIITLFKELKTAMTVLKEFQLMTKAVQLLNLSFLANPIFLVIAALVALGVGLFIAYKKSETFRKFIDGLWQSIQKAWDKILGFFKALPGIVGGAISAVADWFQKLPGQIASALGTAMEAVIDFVTKLPERIAFMIGFLIGMMIKFVVDYVKFWINLGTAVTEAVVGFITKLPGYFMTALTGILNFIIEWVPKVVAKAIELGSQFLSAIIGFISRVPGEVANFIGQVPGAVSRFIGNAAGAAGNIASSIFNGIKNGITGLPGTVGDIIGRVIDAFKDMVKRAFNAAKNLAGSLWDGFKKGLGINSPSYIEKAMFAMTDNVERSKGILSKQVMKIQGIASTLPDGSSAFDFRPPTAPGAGAMTVGGGGYNIEHLEINNPVAEPAEESLFTAMQKLEYIGAGAR